MDKEIKRRANLMIQPIRNILLTIIVSLVFCLSVRGQNFVNETKNVKIGHNILLNDQEIDTLSQDMDEHRFPQYWISGSLLGMSDGLTGISFSANYARSNWQLLSLRYVSGEYTGLRPASQGVNALDKVKELALMYGIIADGNYWQTSLSTGIGWAKQERWHRLGQNNVTSFIGIPIEARAGLKYRNVGLGAKIMGFISKESFGGVGLYINIGDL